MIVPVLKYLDLNEDVENKKDFKISGHAYIGTTDMEDANSFYFRVMTPSALLSILEEDKISIGREMFIVNEFDVVTIEQKINEILADCIRPTWEEAAEAINKYMGWEYDNVQYITLEEAMEIPELDLYKKVYTSKNYKIIE